VSRGVLRTKDRRNYVSSVTIFLTVKGISISTLEKSNIFQEKTLHTFGNLLFINHLLRLFFSQRAFIIQKVPLPLALPNKNNLYEFSYGVTGHQSCFG
jgi:hypothetical protein